MTALKAGEVEAFLRKPDFSRPLVLLYGPDRGLVSERATTLAKASGVALDDPFSAIRLDASSISADPDKLANEAFTVSMFGGKRLIWVRDAGNDATLVAQIGNLVENPPEATLVILEGGDLNKSSKLRTLVERAKTATALPCYQDNARALQSLIDETFSASGQNLTLDARRYLASRLGGDRQASRAELEKLALYTHGQREVSLDDAQAILGDASALDLDMVTNAVLTGDLTSFDTALARLLASGGSAQQVLAATIRQFQQLDLMCSEMETTGRNASAIIAGQKPPLYFDRKTAFETALRKWTGRAVSAALDRLQTAVLESRKARGLEQSVARTALLALAIQAARRR